MKKFALIFLIIVIILTSSFIALRLWSLGDEQNYFNTTLRQKFARSPFFRQILALQFDGDAASDYLGKRYIASTLLHEFGHQIALPHNNTPGCLMNEHAENDHRPKTNVRDIVQDFCEEEKNKSSKCNEPGSQLRGVHPTKQSIRGKDCFVIGCTLPRNDESTNPYSFPR